MPLGIVILYFLFEVDRGKHSWQSNPFLSKYEAIDEGHTSLSEVKMSKNYKKKNNEKMIIKLEPTIRFPAN